MESQLSYFKSWKMMLWKCCTQYASKYGKLSRGHRTRKGQFSFQPQRKAMPKNAQTTTQMHLSHTLVKQCSNFSKPGFSNTWTVNFQILKLVLEKTEEIEIQLPTFAGSSKKQESSRQKHIFLLYWLCQSLWVCGSQTVENSERDGHSRPPDLPLEKPVCRSGSNRTGHGTADFFQIGKGVCQGCILSACLFNLYAEVHHGNAALAEAQARIRIAGLMSITSDMQMAPPLCQKVKRN